MGILIAALIIFLWGSHLAYILLNVEVSFSSVSTYIHIIIQGYLYTGLFITAHDAMHGTVAPKNKAINNLIGYLASFLFAGMSYKRLLENHKLHHKYPGTEKDPDFNVKSQNFFIWWGSFLLRYTTIPQLIVMAVVFNVFKLAFGINESNIILFWVVPAFLGTFQLFFFGTFLPHRLPHNELMEPHKSRSLKKNHFIAMISCYFFGYHFEHHHSPGTPWWQLYKSK